MNKTSSWRYCLVLGLMGLALPGACGSPVQPENLAVEEKTLLQQRNEYGLYLSARYAEGINDIKKANEFYEAALKHNNETPELLHKAFVINLNLGKYEEATSIASRLLEYDGEQPLALLLLMAKELKSGNNAKALESLKQVPRRGVYGLLGSLANAWIAAADKRTNDALAALKPLAENPQFIALHDFHAALINDLGEHNQAALELYQKVVKSRHGLTLHASMAAASFLLRNDMPDKAKAIYDSFLARYPDLPFPEASNKRYINNAQSGLAEAFFSLASSLKQTSSLSLAMSMARIAVYLEPNQPVIKHLIADILEEEQRYQEANVVYDQIPSSSWLYWLSRLRKAENLFRVKETEMAIKMFETLAAERPERSDPLSSLGDILRSEKRYAEAIDAYDRAIARISKIEARHWVLFYAKGVACERAKRWSDAESSFKKALELEPDQPSVLNYLGYSWVEQGVNLQAARKMIEKAVELSPGDGYITDSLGWVLYRMGDFNGSVKYLERAVILRPEDPVINDHLGDAYWKVGRRNEAKYQWNRSLIFKPDQENIPEIKRKIEYGLDSK